MNRQGFTLVETLMALTLTALLAAGSAMLVMEVTQAWANRETAPAFRRHASGLGRMLEAALRQTGKSQETVFEVPPGLAPTEPAALKLSLRNLAQLVPLAPGMNPDGEGWLTHEREAGLILYWRTLQERRMKSVESHRLVLSRWCESCEWLQYELTRNRWTSFTPGADIASGNVRRRLVLHLRKYGETAEIHLNLDPLPENEPGY